MVSRIMLIATAVGIALFVLDLTFGWLTFIISPFPVLFIIALIIGIIAGDIGDAARATLIAWFFGILIGCLLAPLIFLGLFWTDESPITSEELLLLPLFVIMWSTRGSFINMQIEGSLITIITAAAVWIIIWAIVTPVIYLLSFAMAAIGGFIGKRVHKKLDYTETKTLYQSNGLQEMQQ